MKKIILSLSLCLILGLVFLGYLNQASAVLTNNWTCKLATNTDGSGTAEIWGNLRRPIYFDETQGNYVIEREFDTLLKNNKNSPTTPWLPYKYLLCTK